MAGVERLGHRAEIVAQAAGFRTGDRQCDGGFFRIEPAQLCASHGAAEGSDGSGRVIALLLVPGRNRIANFVGNFHAQMESQH